MWWGGNTPPPRTRTHPILTPPHSVPILTSASWYGTGAACSSGAVLLRRQLLSAQPLPVRPPAPPGRVLWPVQVVACQSRRPLPAPLRTGSAPAAAGANACLGGRGSSTLLRLLLVHLRGKGGAPLGSFAPMLCVSVFYGTVFVFLSTSVGDCSGKTQVLDVGAFVGALTPASQCTALTHTQ